MSVWAGPDDRDPLSLPATDDDYVGALQRDICNARIAYSPDLGLPVEPEVARVVCDAVGTLQALGGQVEQVDLETERDLVQQFHLLWIGMEAAQVGGFVDQYGSRMTRGVREEVARGSSISAVDYWNAERARSRYYEKIRAVLSEYEFIVCPTMAVPPPSVHMFTDGPEEVNGELVDRKTGWTLAFPFNMSTHPAASIPCGFTPDHLPVGMQVVGRRFCEVDVLRLAARFEEARPWAGRRPAFDGPRRPRESSGSTPQAVDPLRAPDALHSPPVTVTPRSNKEDATWMGSPRRSSI